MNPPNLALHRVPIAINGKFIKGKFTAVGLVGAEYLRALPANLPNHPAADRVGPLVLFVQRGTDLGAIPPGIEVREGGSLGRHLWEQIKLPRMAKGCLTVNLCNLGPVASRNALTIIHDTNVYETPETYSKAFVAYYKTIFRVIGPRHRRIVTISQSVRDAIIRHGIAPAEKIRVIHNGVDHVLRPMSEPEIVSRLGLTPGCYVLALANTYAHKNISLLIEAFSAVGDNGLQLVLFGKDSAADFRNAGVEPSRRVVFTGHVSDGERRALYENALCFAFPSTTEGFGLPPGEAMALGCPAVVAPCGAIPEVCGDAAIYVDPHDPAAWMEVFRALANDEALRRSHVEKGRERMADFTWDRAASALIDVVAEVAEEMSHGR